MAHNRPGHVYEPIAIDVTVNDWLYQVVTLSVYPGGRATVTLLTRGLTKEEASDQAIRLWKSINT